MQSHAALDYISEVMMFTLETKAEADRWSPGECHLPRQVDCCVLEALAD